LAIFLPQLLQPAQVLFSEASSHSWCLLYYCPHTWPGKISL
jgi:hypothetical protein